MLHTMHSMLTLKEISLKGVVQYQYCAIESVEKIIGGINK